MAATDTQPGLALIEKVDSALSEYRLGHIDHRDKQVLIDEAFSKYRATLDAASDYRAAGTSPNI